MSIYNAKCNSKWIKSTNFYTIKLNKDIKNNEGNCQENNDKKQCLKLKVVQQF